MTQLSTTARRARTSVRVLAPYGRPYRPHAVEGWIASLFLVAARLAFPWPLRGVMEEAVHPHSTGRAGTVLSLIPAGQDPVPWLIGAFLLIVIVWGISEWRQRNAFSRYAAGLTRDLQVRALDRLPKAHAGGRPAGELIATVTSDCHRIKSGVKSGLVGVIRNGAFFLGVAVILVLVDQVIGLIFLLGGLGSIVLGGIGAWRSYMIVRRSLRRDAKLTHRIHARLSGDEPHKKHKRSEGTVQAKSSHVEGLTTLAAHVVIAAATCLILLMTLHDTRSGTMSPGEAFTVLAYLLYMHNKTVSLGRSIVRLGRLLPSAERVARLVKPAKAKIRTEPSRIGIDELADQR